MHRSLPSRRRPRTTAAQRTELLAAFAASGLSAAAFARRQDLHYTTFCGWRHAQAKTRPAPGFVQVELPPSAPPTELIVELGAGVRLRLTSAAQLELAAGLLHHLRAATPC
jgi:transposase-like protein